MMRFSPLYAPDGMMSGGHYVDRFDDGLVHNHHWAVTADEAYPSHSSALEREFGLDALMSNASPSQGHGNPTHDHDRHDDGLVHNHGWAVTER